MLPVQIQVLISIIFSSPPLPKGTDNLCLHQLSDDLVHTPRMSFRHLPPRKDVVNYAWSLDLVKAQDTIYRSMASNT